MARYIDADALLERMKRDPLFTLVEKYGVSGVIEAEPTADVAEVKHGKWIYTMEILERGGHISASKCSVCKKLIFPHSKPNYCPNCGADMRERRDDGETRVDV